MATFQVGRATRREVANWSSPDLVDTKRAVFWLSFELVLSYQVLVVPGDEAVWREVAEAAVEAASIVEGFKVIEDCSAFINQKLDAATGSQPILSRLEMESLYTFVIMCSDGSQEYGATLLEALDRWVQTSSPTDLSIPLHYKSERR